MEYTRVEDDGHTLTLWWPESHEATPRGLKILKAQYAGEEPWTSIIKASETCAVFGLATPRCLEHHEIKTCRNSVPPGIYYELRNIMFKTHLISTSSELYATPLSYALGRRLVLCSPERDILTVTRVALPLQDVVRVKFKPGGKGRRILKNLGFAQEEDEVMKKQCRE
ncbi:hypothetical protein F5884DRAFT_758810 [Xylogone sp. PMI_703]|nr:hypothetical protein F5884DRAFT_758810 [Xylogone sp. PMI_703]